MKEQTGSTGDSSAYQQFYKAACDYVHPRAISFVPHVFNVAGDVDPQVLPRFNSERLMGVLREIALLCVFMCYAAKNAAVDEDAILPDWREGLDELAREVTGEPVGDLTRDWDREPQEFERIHSYFRPADEVEEFLDAHPNSRRNILRRAAEDKRPGDSGSG